MITANPELARLFKRVERFIAPYNRNVVIEGETGTGKENIARAIHHHSDRSNGPFVAINCASITETIAGSELFGHVKGAFTGAYMDKRGVFEQAHGGTLFLDEISSLSADNQARLLRVLQEGELVRLGSLKVIKVNVRLVSASNRDLWDLVRKGRFRNDLYFRIGKTKLRLLPLRHRPEDIHCLAEYLLDRFRDEMALEVKVIDDTAMQFLLDYNWPGNVRELENIIGEASIEAHVNGKEKIDPSHLPEVITTYRKWPMGIGSRSRTRKHSDTRQAILYHLSCKSPRKVGELSSRIGRDRSVIFKQSRKMESEGLVTIDRKRGNTGSRIHLNDKKEDSKSSHIDPNHEKNT